MECPGCGAPLSESIVSRPMDLAGEGSKSCPKCSERAGKHIFYKHEAFGDREYRGALYWQSYCTACRSMNAAHAEPSMTC